MRLRGRCIVRLGLSEGLGMRRMHFVGRGVMTIVCRIRCLRACLRFMLMFYVLYVFNVITMFLCGFHASEHSFSPEISTNTDDPEKGVDRKPYVAWSPKKKKELKNYSVYLMSQRLLFICTNDSTPRHTSAMNHNRVCFQYSCVHYLVDE